MNDETKHEKFKRIATKRVVEILKKLELLENCSNKSHYSYSDDEIAKIFSTLEKRLKETKSSFRSSKSTQDFSL